MFNTGRNVFWLGFAEATGRFGSLFLLSISSRMLSKEEFAQYILYISFTGMLFTLSQIGTGMQGVRELCIKKKYTEIEVLINVIIIRLSCILIFSTITLYFHNIILPNMSTDLILVGIFFIFFKLLTVDWVLRAKGKVRVLAWILIGSSLSNVIVGILLILRDSSAFSLAIAMLISGFIMAFSSWLPALERIKNIFFLLRKPLRYKLIIFFKSSAAIGAAGIAVTASQTLPIFALNWHSNAKIIGVFGGIQRILQLCLAPLVVLSLAHFPQLSTAAGNHTQKRKLMDAIVHYTADLILVSLWLMTSLIIFSKLIIGLILGKKFIVFERFVIYIAFLIPLYYLRTSFSDTSIALGERLPVLIGCLLGLFGSLIICITIIPHINENIQIIAAIGALLISELCVITTILIHLLKKDRKAVIYKAKKLTISIATIFGILILYLLNELDYLIEPISQILILLIVCFMTTFYIKDSSLWRYREE